MDAPSTAAPASTTFAEGFSEAGITGSRYDALLRQIVQLNTDLQKTAALSQTLQRERDDAQQLSSKLKCEVSRLQDRCDKMQLMLVQETEQKIESDRKHEELIAKWKKQLEMKARAFDSLQKKFAPPKDLEQLRIKIQEELEGPFHQRVNNLQDELERQRQVSFEMQREFEAIKAEYEQSTIDHDNEMECIRETYEVTMGDLKRKLQLAEEMAANSQLAESFRKLEQQRDATDIEVKALRSEVQEAREELQRVCHQKDIEQSSFEMRLADEATRIATLELDLKTSERQLTKAKDECENLRLKWNNTESTFLESRSETENLREQLKQKEAATVSCHNLLSMKFRDERATWEREQTSLKDRIHVLSLKLQAAEAAAQSSSSAAAKAKEDLNNSVENSLLIKSQDEELKSFRGIVAEAEKKIVALEKALSQCQHDFDEATHKFQTEKGKFEKVVEALNTEKKLLTDKQASYHELTSRMKTECITLRTKLKEAENDYHTLQLKHRETIQYQEEMQLEREEALAKLKYTEQDYAMLTEQLDRAKQNHATVAEELNEKCKKLEKDSQAHRVALQRETHAALSKAIKELNKSKKKCEAYKLKCLEIHGKFKQHVEEVNSKEEKLRQDRQEHAAELRQLLNQLSEAENEKTALMQRQIELGFPPPSTIIKKVLF
ncbi:putative centrosomal protein of 83kDa [Plasmopara halstedii]